MMKVSRLRLYFLSCVIARVFLGILGCSCVLHSSPPGPLQSGLYAPRVCVSVKPIHSLVSIVMKGVGSPDLLIDGYPDSDIQAVDVSIIEKLKNADLLIWVSPNFETFLLKSIRAHQPKHVALINTPGLKLLYQRDSSGCFYDDNCACIRPRTFRSIDSSLELITELTVVDPHIWLDIDNVKKIVTEIAHQLSVIDCEHRDIYRNNANRYIDHLANFSQELDKRAEKIKNFHFVSLFDAYSYIESRYHFHNLGAELVTEQGRPSFKSMEKIRKAIECRRVKSFFVETLRSSVVEKNLAREFNLVLYKLDPLGIEIPGGESHYERMMDRLFSSFERCALEYGLCQ